MDYESKTVVELKKLLSSRGLDQTGRKADLVQRLKDSDEISVKKETKKTIASGKGKNKRPADYEESESDDPASEMTVAQLKDELNKRGLITKGLKADLVKRLSARLEKEKNPLFKPRGPEKIRYCNWCGEVLVKKVKPRSDRIDRFYTCPRFPDCTYTENMSGHSKKKKITDEQERTKLSNKAKALGQAMQSWRRDQWADYNSRI